MPRKPRSNWTIKATARAGKGHRQRLEQVIKQEGELYNSALKVLETANQNGITLELQHLELQLTQVRQEYPMRELHGVPTGRRRSADPRTGQRRQPGLPGLQDCSGREAHEMAADGRWTNEEICPPDHG